MTENIFDRLESNVRSYCRRFPAVLSQARGAIISDEGGRRYIDLLAGAGTLNYGHNHPALKAALAAYIADDGITHALDLHTVAKRALMAEFEATILQPRGLAYRLMFPGPTGTNAVEAALKLARKATGRTTVAAFTNGFHGMSLGSLAATGSTFKRRGAGLPLGGVDRYPFEGYFGPEVDTIAMIERLLDDPSSGFDPPAAFLVETVQGEGGLHAASGAWLGRLAALARRHGSLLIVDDIQAGCGRTGTFFSFEPFGVRPDLVCLSKSLSGFGLPLALVLIRPDLDLWQPGEHNGTFRGHNLAFVTARAALAFWRDEAFLADMGRCADILDRWLEDTVAAFPGRGLSARGRGLMRGLATPSGAIASEVSADAFRRGVMLETSGGDGEVLKFLPPLTIPPELLQEALDHVGASLEATLTRPPALHPVAAE